jgi:ribosomal-protein-alanine N-acetyltransferase
MDSVRRMLKGKSVNLRLMEREDLPLLREWVNDLDFVGEFEPVSQETQRDLERQYDALTEGQWFFIEKKDGTKIGYVAHFLKDKLVELGYSLVPDERGKGYGTEAVRIAVDYLFLSKNIVRIQVETDPENVASQRILQKAGFTKEGVIRKSFFCRGEWRDTALFSILREEWKEPRIIGQHRK